MGPGFYCYNQDGLLYAPNEVCNTNFNLVKELHDTYEYPVFGWYWFDSEEEARTFFGVAADFEPEL